MEKNVGSQKIALLAYDSSGPKTGDAANITPYVSQDGAAEAALTDSSATEIDATNMPGVYVFDVTQAESNANLPIFGGKSSTAGVKIDPVIIYTRPPAFNTSVAQTGDSFARLGAPAGASVSADILAIDNLVDDLESRVGTPSNLGGGATIAANLADIEGQTDDIGAAGAGLTALASAANLATLDGKVDTVDNLIDTEIGAIQTTIAAIETDTQDIQSRLPAALVSGRMDSSVGAMAANVMTAAAAAADLTTELQSGLATAAAVSTLQTSVDDLPTNAELAASQASADDATLAAIAALSIPTAADNATAVWAAATRTLTGSQGVKKNTAKAAFMFLMTDSTNHLPATGLTVTATRSLDGASFGACANSVSEVASGWYKIDLAAGDLNGDTVALKFTATGADALNIGLVTGA